MLKEPEAPRRSEENDTRPVSGRGNDRLLLWCLAASLLINFGFGVWLSFADLNGEKGQQEANKVMHFKTYIPPIKKPKPPPKPKKLPPPPKIKVVKVVPKIVPRPTPPRPAPPRPVVISHTQSPNAIPIGPPTPTAPPQPVAPTETPDAPPQAKPPPPTPPAPAAPPAPPAPVYHAPPPPPPPPKPSNYQEIDSRPADVTGIDAPDPGSVSDPTQITGPCIISFEVSESGHISSVRVKKSSGSSEFDQLCMQAVEKAHGVYAIQGHIPYAQRSEQTFSQ